MSKLHEVLARHRERWQEKPVLRTLYRDYYRRIANACRGGRTLEIGAGSGDLAPHLESVVRTDILFTDWLSCVADAQSLPFRDGVFQNIVMVDVLHHLPSPRSFFAEAERVLSGGGRIVMLEPAITPLSFVAFKLAHDEPVDLSQDPLAEPPEGRRRDPFDSNQAIPSLLFGRHRRRFESSFPRLAILKTERLSLWAYPLSGGFQAWSLLPERWVTGLLRLEDALKPLAALQGFRLLVVLERR